MRRYWMYLKYVLKHKWYVFLAGVKLGVPLWILILHDWDKFLPDEFIPYARFFYEPDGTKKVRRNKTGYYKPYNTGDDAFDNAWFLHQKRNKHHWQWWCFPTEDGIEIKPMSEVYRLEMLADWIGAGRAQGTPDTKLWYITNEEKLLLHTETRAWFESVFSLYQ